MNTLARYKSTAEVRAMLDRVTLADVARHLGPQASRFFEPTEAFLAWAAENAGDRGVTDVGAGQGHVADALVRRGVKSLAIDLRGSDGELPLVVPADGTAFRYPPGSVAMICRPCHGEFPSLVVRRAVECGVHAVWYVGLPKNVAADLYGFRSRFKVALTKAGKQGEKVYAMVIP